MCKWVSAIHLCADGEETCILMYVQALITTYRVPIVFVPVVPAETMQRLFRIHGGHFAQGPVRPAGPRQGIRMTAGVAGVLPLLPSHLPAFR